MSQIEVSGYYGSIFEFTRCIFTVKLETAGLTQPIRRMGCL